MKFCSRCQGGERASHCPVCGGSGFIADSADDGHTQKVQKLKEEKRKEAEREKIRLAAGYHSPTDSAPAPVKKKNKKKKEKKEKKHPLPHKVRPPKKPANDTVSNADTSVPVRHKTPSGTVSRQHTERAAPEPASSDEPLTIAQQLATLKGKIALAPEPAAPATSQKKRRKRKKKASWNPMQAPAWEPPKQERTRFPNLNNKAGYMMPGGGSRNVFAGDDDDDSNGVSGAFEAHHQEEDGSRYMGHSFRERDGRFGSYPVHDNHDDH